MIVRSIVGIMALIMILLVRPGAEDGVLHAMTAAPEHGWKVGRWHRGVDHDPAGPTPMSIPLSGGGGDSMSYCDSLLNRGALILNDGDCKTAYDILRRFMEQCPTYVGGHYNSGVVASDMFARISAAVGCWTAGGKERWPQYVEWLKSVLYQNPDTSWYCHDAFEMLTAQQENQNAGLAIIQYVTSTKKCIDDFWGTMYRNGMKQKHKAWLDSLELDFAKKYGFNAWQDSAINADTLAHPFDSTYGSIDDYGLTILRGQQYASSVHYKDLPSTALLQVRVTENPFDATIGVSIDMQREALVTMELRDLVGRQVPLEYGKYQLMPQGTETRTFSTDDLPAGTYYLRVSTDLGEVRTLKLVKKPGSRF
jgi:hypothetical protein